MDKFRKIFYYLVLFAAAFVFSVSVYAKDGLRVYFVDIGQGDCQLIECDGEYMLIDAGDTNKGSQVVGFLEQQGVDKFKYIIATHPHADHIGGMADVLEKYDTDEFITTSKVATTKCYEKMLNAIANKNMDGITTPVQGEKYSLGSSEFTIITPTDGVYTGDNTNCYSVGIKLTYGDTSFVMCGDAEKEEEDLILKSGLDISADVLKCGHHGSRTSTSNGFLDSVNPQYAVISCGKDNSYGHPHTETINKLESKGIGYFRTDEMGTIVAESDGSIISWNNPSSGSTGWSQKNGNSQSDYAVFGMAYGIAEIINESKDNVSAALKNKAAANNSVPEDTYSTYTEPANTGGTQYVLNTRTKKFHNTGCSSVNRMSASNKEYTSLSRTEIINKGYSPCKNCNP